jgi:hypothetical protein
MFDDFFANHTLFVAKYEQNSLCSGGFGTFGVKACIEGKKRLLFLLTKPIQAVTHFVEIRRVWK